MGVEITHVTMSSQMCIYVWQSISSYLY